jgi:putative MATE family efflux protein
MFHATFFKDLKTISNIAIPVMLTILLQSLLNSVDIYFISKMGKQFTSAAALGASAANVVFILGTLTTAGIVAFVSQNYGAGRHSENQEVIADSFLLSSLFGLFVGAITFVFARPLTMIMFNPTAETLNNTVIYVKIILLGTPFIFGAGALRSVFQGLGKTKVTLIIFGIANLINLVLDPIFIFHFNMGIAGAAWATLISNVVSLLMIVMMIINDQFKGQWRGLIRMRKSSLSTDWKLLKIGSWACLQQIARPITGMLMFRIVFEVGGDTGAAAFGIGGQLLSYTFIILAGLSTGLSVLVGQSIGAGETHRLKDLIRTGLVVCGINMLLFALPYIFLAKPLLGIFTKDLGVIAIGVRYLWIIYVGLMTVIWTITYTGVFQGAGDSFPPMVASTVANVVVKVPLAYLLVKFFHMGIDSVWVAISVSVVVEAAIIIGYYKKGHWMKVRL